jgi:hypothetical protein
MPEKSHFLYCLGAAMLLGLASSCNRVEPHRPELIAVQGDLAHPVSNLSLPVLLNLEEVEDLVNQKLNGEIYRDGSFEGDNLVMTISKIGRIEVNLVGNRLYYRLPLHIWLEGHVEKKLLGAVKVQKNQQLDFSLVLHFCSTLNIDQDWHPVVHTTLQKYEWIKKPSIQMGFVKIGIAKLVEKKIEEQMPTLLGKIDASVHQKLDIKPMAMKLWTGIQKPIRLNRKFQDVWLQAKPQRLYMSHINGSGGYLRVNLRLEALLQTVAGDSPTVAPAEDLPPLLFHPDTSNRFDLYVKSKLPFELLNSTLNQHLGRKELAWEGYGIGMQDFELMGSDSMILLKVHVDGEVNGDIYLSGRPYYQDSSGVLGMSGLDFHLASEEALVNTADWLMHDYVLEQLGKSLQLPLADKLARLPELADNAIAKSKISRNVDITLDSLRLVPQEILVTSSDLQLLVRATGNVSMAIERLPVKQKEAKPIP